MLFYYSIHLSPKDIEWIKVVGNPEKPGVDIGCGREMFELQQ